MTTTPRSAAAPRLRLVLAGSLIVVLAACATSDGSRPSISATLAPDASIVLPTRPPATDAPAPPAETAAPETPPPEQPQPTAAPETAPSGTAAEVTADESDGTVWWPWVLLAIVAIVVIALVVRGRRPSQSWQLRATTLLDEIDQLTTHLVSITPGGMHAVAQADARALATMRATLRDVIATAPNDTSRAALNELSVPIAGLHGEIDAFAMSAYPSAEPDVAPITNLATQLHTASAAARAGLAIQV